MAILSGYIKTKRYRKQDDNYILQSELTMSDSVEFEDGKTLTEKIKSHSQSASNITSGTFSGDVKVPASTKYTECQLRNAILTPTDPGDGSASSYPNGSLIFVYTTE